MNSPKTQTPNADADEAAASFIHLRVIEAWNKGGGEGFAAPFTESADFIAFEGTHLKGRQEIASFHQHAELKTLNAPTDDDGKISIDWKLGPDFIGDVWAARS